MVPRTLRAISATAVCALMAMAIEYVTVPQAARIIPGVLMYFSYQALRPFVQFFPQVICPAESGYLPVVGVSIVITVCASVLLGATVGLSQRSVAVALGGLTLVACFFALLRERRDWRSFEDLDE